MFSFWRRAKSDASTDSGAIYKIYDQFYWDNAKSPAILSGAEFGKLLDITLDKRELASYNMACFEAMIVMPGEKRRTEHQVISAAYKKISKHLKSLDSCQLERLLNCEWQNNYFDVLKVYLAIVEHYESTYSSIEIRDARDSTDALLVCYRGSPSHYVRRSDLFQITCRPDNFTASMTGATWKFDRRRGRIVIEIEDSQNSSTWIGLSHDLKTALAPRRNA